MEILKYCGKYKLIEREQQYTDLLNPEYNILTYAGSRLGFKHNEATKELFRSKELGLNEKRF